MAARKAAGQPQALEEITIVAQFPDPYATGDTQVERDQAKATHWAPAHRDFMAVATSGTTGSSKAIYEVSTFLSMVSSILFVDPSKPNSSAFRPVQSLKRINVLSHGNPGLIAMSGTVDTNGKVMLATGGGTTGLDGPLDIAAAQAAADPTMQLANGKPLAQSLRDRLAPDAEIFLYACHTGQGPAILLMQELKALFKVKIRGFSQSIAYCPVIDATHILDRTRTAVGNCDAGAQSGFRHLTPDRNF